jgi:hypothetical protein
MAKDRAAKKAGVKIIQIDDAGSREHGTNFLMDRLGKSLES